MNPNISRLSHVGLQTSDLDASLEWYTKVLGLTPAFTLVNDGKPWIVYLHVTDTTFIELFAPRPGMGAVAKGHFSLETDDIDAAVADLLPRLPEYSVKSRDIITGKDGTRIFNFFDPDGHRIEFQQLLPVSSQAIAMAALKGNG